MALVAGTSVGRYEIQSPLGAGGMGEVYLARDPLLGRTVAVKLLPAAFAADPDRLRRFEQEAQTTAALNHPRILAVHDIGRIGDQPFIVMEYVRGETLAAHVRKGRPSLARALEIGIEIANALGAAHRARVVHRDLKPANVMVTGDGHVKVLDFGLAKFLQHETSLPTGEDGEQRVHTTTGQIMGTPPYMSPEQLLGDRVDERTDIYTLGVMLFELVTGHRPHDGDIGELIRNAAQTTPIKTVRDVDPAIAPEISETIARCMARNPANRFQTAGALEAELQHVLAEVSSDKGRPSPRSQARSQTFGTVVRKRRLHGYAAWLLAGTVAIGALAAAPLISRLNATKPPVIAVLPLENLSNDPSQALLGIGVANWLTSALGRLSAISVVPLESMLDAGALPRGRDEIARELGATMLLEGSIQQVGATFRVIARLVTPDGRQVWSGQAEGRLDEMLSMQNKLAESLLARLRITVTDDDRQRIARVLSQNEEARTAYYQGLALMERPDGADFETAVGYFKKATALDARFSEAFTAQGEAYRRRSVRTKDPALMEKAKALLTDALRVDKYRPEVRLLLARVYRSTGEPFLALDEVRRVLADRQENDDAHRLLGELLAAAGNLDGALEELLKAESIRPDYWPNQEALGLFYGRTGRLQEAIAAFTKITTLKPDDAMPYQQLGSMYLLKEDYVSARKSFERSNELRQNAGSHANLGFIAFAERRYSDAVREYEAAARLEPGLPANYGNLADAYQKIPGRQDKARAAYLEAIKAGEQALKLNQGDMITVSQLGVYSAKAGLRDDAQRYADRASANRTDPNVLYLRAVTLALIDKPNDAMTLLLEAIKRDYPVHLAVADEDLKSLKSLPAFQTLSVGANKR